jgi:hypothetical protein
MMLIIVDANTATKVFPPSFDASFSGLHNALFGKRLRVVAVMGGELGREYLRITKILSVLATLNRAGRLRRVNDAAVDTGTANVKAMGLCCSDDEHVIALALIGKVRLLCSEDQGLHADFTNPKLLKPKGKVYQGNQHNHLLDRM